MTKKQYILLPLLIIVLLLSGCLQQQQQSSIKTTKQEQSPELTQNRQTDQSTHSPQQDQSTRPADEQREAESTKLKVHILDVGQADAILLQTPDGKNLLIDAGNNADQMQILDYLNKLEIKRLDIVIGTHPHEDHIGSLDAVLNNFLVGQVIMPKVTANTDAFRDVLAAVKAKRQKITTARAGLKLELGPLLNAYLAAPNSAEYKNINNYSAVLRVAYGQTSFLFLGDAEKMSEAEMLENGQQLKADVIKVGHHGGEESTTLKLLKAVKPKYAVISVGADNSYGHPAKKTISKLAAAKVQVYRTDRDGTIVFVSDGSKISITTGE